MVKLWVVLSIAAILMLIEVALSAAADENHRRPQTVREAFMSDRRVTHLSGEQSKDTSAVAAHTRRLDVDIDDLGGTGLRHIAITSDPCGEALLDALLDADGAR